MSTLHVMADARGRWRVVDDDQHERVERSEYTTADAAERAAWRRGAGSVLVHDRYGRTHNAPPVSGARFPNR